MTLDCLYFGLRLLEEKRSASATAPSTVAPATTPYFILKDNILQPRQVRLGECNYDYIEATDDFNVVVVAFAEADLAGLEDVVL